MNSIDKVRSISVWIFIIPFLSINICLFIVTNVHQILEPGVPIFPTFPYFDGGVSISRTVRYYPLYLIFKPAMFLTSFLLIRYWLNTKNIIEHFNKDYPHTKKIIFFGLSSAILLTVHSIFLGIKFDNDLYKLFRRVVMLSFIIFELIAQAYLKRLKDDSAERWLLMDEKRFHGSAVFDAAVGETIRQCALHLRQFFELIRLSLQHILKVLDQDTVPGIEVRL